MKPAIPLLTVLAVQGCAQLLGTSDYRASGGASDGGVPAAAPACGGYEFPRDAPCGECLLQSCCDPLAACLADATCDPWEACVAACGPDDWACHGACGQQLGRTNHAVGDVVTCKFTKCRDTCAQPEVPAMLGGSDCAECAAAKCGPSTAAFGATAAADGGRGAEEVIDCYLRANSPFDPDPGSLLSCGALWYAPAFQASQQWSICLGLVCPIECGLGDFVSCASRYDFPLPDAPIAEVTVWVGDNIVLAQGVPYARADGQGLSPPGRPV